MVFETWMAYQAAINVLRDTVESGRLPHGSKIDNDVAALHTRAADHLQFLLQDLASETQREDLDQIRSEPPRD